MIISFRVGFREKILYPLYIFNYYTYMEIVHGNSTWKIIHHTHNDNDVDVNFTTTIENNLFQIEQ